ncbi:MAG: hypothetical protein AAFY26_24435 [Cyanobacteria bacterium J06638_22]
MDNAQEYYVDWGALALITAGIAQGKNRSGCNWFLLGMILGPLATFILVAFYDKLEDENH